jgi:hypothetical protein
MRTKKLIGSVWLESQKQRMADLTRRFQTELEQLVPDVEAVTQWIMSNCGSHERMGALMFVQSSFADYLRDMRSWFVVLGNIWEACDNIGSYQDDVSEIVNDWVDNPLTVIPELMTSEERAALEQLPDEITIFRGCGPENKHGLSWSLSRDVAIRFPFSPRYWTDQPLLLSATVNKARVAALKLGRNEHEVIVVDLPEACWREESISEPPSR